MRVETIGYGVFELPDREDEPAPPCEFDMKCAHCQEVLSQHEVVMAGLGNVALCNRCKPKPHPQCPRCGGTRFQHVPGPPIPTHYECKNCGRGVKASFIFPEVNER